MAHEIRRGRLLTLIRKSEPDDLEAQVKALKKLEKQPAFIAAKPVFKKTGSRVIDGNSHPVIKGRQSEFNLFSIKNRLTKFVLRFFRKNRRPGFGRENFPL